MATDIPPVKSSVSNGIRDLSLASAYSNNAFTPLELPRNVTERSQRLQDLEQKSLEAKRKVSQANPITPVDGASMNVEEYINVHLTYLNQADSIEAEAREALQDMYEAGDINHGLLAQLTSAQGHKRAIIKRDRANFRTKRRRISLHLSELVERNPDPSSYADALGAILKECGSATTDRGILQETWKKEVREYYKSTNPEDLNEFWCPFIRGYIQGTQMVTAHIIPKSLPGRIVLGVMGQKDTTEDGQDILWDIRNGMTVSREVERALDEGRIAVVPLTRFEDGSADRLKVIVLDQKSMFRDKFDGPDDPQWAKNKMMCSFGEIKTWKELHNSELIFKNPTNRPGRRNLFFHFITTILRRQIYEPPGWEEDTKLIQDIKGVWATPGKYFRRSALGHLMRSAGIPGVGAKDLNDLVEEWYKYVSYDEDLRTPATSDPYLAAQTVADELIGSAIKPMGKSTTYDWDEENEDNEDFAE